MGNPDGSRTLSQDTYWRILRKQLTLTGTWNSSYGGEGGDWKQTVVEIASGNLQTKPMISHVLEEAELKKGLSIIKDRLMLSCKMIIEMQ